MARRSRTFGRTLPLVKQTIPTELNDAIMKFRNEYMKMHGRYINNAEAGRYLATKINRVKPPKKKWGLYDTTL